MYVRDLEGGEYVTQITYTLDEELGGDRQFSATIKPNKPNAVFLEDISEMWTLVDDNNVEYKIIYLKKQGEGNSLSVEIQAVPLFFDDFDNQRIYEEYNQHMTAQAAFTLIFADSGYNFVLHDSFDAVDWQGFGAGESRLETFKRALNRYGAEFEIVGNTVHLKALIGRDTQFMYRYRLNASNIVQEIDASGFWTYAKGYGDFGDGDGGGDWQDAKLVREYTSPLAGILGIRHAPPIKDGRVRVAGAMDKALKAHVDESLRVSVSTDIHDLRKQGYTLAQPQLGDRVFLIDERIGFDEEVRVVAMSITKDWRGNVTHFSITIGDEGVSKRYISNMKTAIDNITNIVNGTQKLPYSVLDNAVLQATKALQNAQTELTFNTNGILAIDKLDPNNVTILNSAGVGVSTDGGATFGQAITGRGINASYIVTGVLDAGQVVVRGGSATDYTLIDASMLESRGRYVRTWRGVTETHDISLRLQNGHFRARNDTHDRSLYFSDFGISSALDGSLNDSASGTLQFFDTQFSTARGITMHSHFGVVAMQSGNNRIVIAPQKEARSGTNDFSFRVKDNTWENSDGWISFGDTSTATYHSGLRFSKYSNTYTIYATDGEGNIGTGHFNAATFVGELRPRGEYNYLRATRTRFVRPGTATDNYADIQFAHALANTIRVNDGDANFYIGTSTGEVRVTNNLLHNGGNIGYRPIRAYEFITDTSVRENKRNIAIYDEDILDVFRNGNAYLYNRENEGSHTKKQLGLMLDEMPYETYSDRGDGFGIYGLVGFLFRGLKQAVEEIDKLKGVS